MNGILICDKTGSYRGVARINGIPDYFEDKGIGGIIQEFLSDCVDPDTQVIEYQLSNISRALTVVDALKTVDCDNEVILYCDACEDIDMSGAEFAGYDVASETLEDSPLQRELFEEDVNSFKYEEYSDFYTNTNGAVLNEYSSFINEFSLFSDRKPAEEIAEYCTWLTERNEYLFEGEKNYKAVKVYIVKQMQF